VKEFETKIKNKIEEINKKEKFATYYNINSNEAQNIIKENNIQLQYDKIKEELNIKEINEYRGILKFEKPNIIGLINDVDHLKLIYNIDNPNINISKGMANLIKIINELSKKIRFEYNEKIGFFTSDPNYIGTGMKIKFTLIINKLNESNLNEWIKDKGYIWEKINDNEIEFKNILTIGLSETEMLANLLFYIQNIINLNK
jgi:protein-arginine kinase